MPYGAVQDPTLLLTRSSLAKMARGSQCTKVHPEAGMTLISKVRAAFFGSWPSEQPAAAVYQHTRVLDHRYFLLG
jgi:hypothetical protein